MKRSRAENVQDPRQTPLLDAHLTQTSLKDHFRVIKPRLSGKENAEPGEIHTLTYRPRTCSTSLRLLGYCPPASRLIWLSVHPLAEPNQPQHARAQILSCQREKFQFYGPCCADAVLSPAAKVPKPPMLLPPVARHDAAQQPQLMLAPKAVPTAVITPTASAPFRKPAAPVLSECGISLSTAPFEFPAPSEDTADITSRLPSYGTAAAGLFMHRRCSPAHAAQRQLQVVSTADPDEVSCRHKPLPARLTRQPTPTASAATFSSAGCAAGSVGQAAYSTASLASWLASSMQGPAGAGAGDDSDCEDDAVSQRWGAFKPAPAAFSLPQTTAAQTAAYPAHQEPAPAAVASPPVDDRPAECPVAVSEELDAGIAAPGPDLVPMLLQLAQGGIVSFAETEGQQQVRHATRLDTR